MVNLKALKTDPKLRDQGVEFHYALEVYFTIRPMPNPEYTSFVRSKSQHLRGGRELDPKVAEKLSTEGIAAHVLSGWRGLEEDDESPLQFSVEQALEILQDEDCVDILNFIVEKATNLSNFRNQTVEASGKN